MSKYKVRRIDGNHNSMMYTWYMEWENWNEPVVALRIIFRDNEITDISIINTKKEVDDLNLLDYSQMSEEELFQHSCTSEYDVVLAAKMIQKSKELQIESHVTTNFSRGILEFQL